MTQNANYNGAGARQCPEYITLTIDADEFGATSATAAVLDIADLPPGAIVISCSLAPEDLFDGSGNDTINVGIKARLNATDTDVSDTVEGLAETDADGLLVGTADNAGAVAAAGGSMGVWIGRKMPYGGTVTATYTPAATQASTGTVRVNIGYIGADRAEYVYGS